MKYLLNFSRNFSAQYKNISKNKIIRKKINKALDLLVTDPFSPSLKTHKANTRIYGYRYSSSVTGDLRIIWDFDKENSLLLLLLAIGSHSGSKRVYR